MPFNSGGRQIVATSAQSGLDPHCHSDGADSNIGSIGIQIGSSAPELRRSNDRRAGRKISEPNVHRRNGFRREGVSN